VTVVGVDEAGRGPLAGPVMAAAVILTSPQFRVLRFEGLGDSKKVPEKDRERLFGRIEELGVRWSAQSASHRRIDKTNILRATLWAMGRAVESLGIKPDVLVVDGNIMIPGVICGRQIAMPKADGKVPSVMAASIIAKVLRDRVMRSLHRIYPGYGFASHKGYPTRSHRAALDMLGPSPVHRLTFSGCGGEIEERAKS
jgi:ribonuclease HII